MPPTAYGHYLAVGITTNDVVVSRLETHKGWMLQSPTSLSNAWADVSGSTTNTVLTIPEAGIETLGFFRIRYPIQ